jgi:hypothetical protein
VRPLSCARLPTANALEFLCWKWKPYPTVVFRRSRLVWVLLYIREVSDTQTLWWSEKNVLFFFQNKEKTTKNIVLCNAVMARDEIPSRDRARIRGNAWTQEWKMFCYLDFECMAHTLLRNAACRSSRPSGVLVPRPMWRARKASRAATRYVSRRHKQTKQR